MKNVKALRLSLLFLLVSNIAGGAYLIQLNLNSSKDQQSGSATATNNNKDSKISQEKLQLETYRKQVVKKTLALKNEDIEMCYQDFLKTDPEKLQGAVKISWTINKQGQVSSVRLLSSDFKNDYLEKCLFDQVKSTTFSPPEFIDEVQVAHKFNFETRSPSSINFETN